MNPTAILGVPPAGRIAEQLEPRLHQAAVQFESILLKDLLKPLAAAFDRDGENAAADTGAGPMAGFAIDAVAGSLAHSGALGFAREIERAFADRSQKNLSGDAKVSASGRR